MDQPMCAGVLRWQASNRHQAAGDGVEMSALSRRGLLAGAGAVALGTTVLTAAPASAAPVEAPSVRPGDRRYDSLLRGDNFRFVGHPDEVRVVSSADQVVVAVNDAVR